MLQKFKMLFCTGILMTAAAAAGCGTGFDKTDGEIRGSARNTEEQITLTVDIAASLNDAMAEIAKLYRESHPDVTIAYNADSSGTLKNQIEEAAGLGVDLFFSAAEAQMDALAEEGYVDGNTVENLLWNRVVLIAAKGSKTKVTGFSDMTEAENLALAGESVPVGMYTRQILETLGISEEVLSMEINACENVSAVKMAVAEGADEIGTVYYSDYYSVKEEVDLIAMAEESWCDPVIYPAGLVQNPEADERTKKAAADFLAFLKTKEAKEIFEKYMFITE